MSFEKILTEVTAEISNQRFLKVNKGTDKIRTYTFSDNQKSKSSLKNKLENEYGNKYVNQIMSIVNHHLENDEIETIEVNILNGKAEDVSSISFDIDEMYELTQELNEVAAEVVAGKIPFNKVFDANGNVIPKQKLVGSETLKVINSIMSALKKQNLLKRFSPNDVSSLDIKSGTKGKFILTDDEGKKYVYKLSTKRIDKIDE